MFRVRLASGEEAVYRSVDELALGIQSGMITDRAEIFHGKSRQWLPIPKHPDYGVAMERAASIVAIEEAPPPAPVQPIGDGLPQVYQMFSRSARELADRRRPRWHYRVAASAAGLVLVAATSLTLLQNPQVTDEVVLPPGALRGSMPARGAPSADLSEQERKARQAPYNLASRLARGKDAATTAMSDSAVKLGLAGLLRPARLASVDSLRQGLAGLAALRPLMLDYRTQLRALHLAYRDSAEGLIRAGSWTRSDAKEWRARFYWPEPGAAAARADTLLSTLARLHTFLLGEANRMSLAAGGFIPGSDSSAATYDRLRSDLTRLRSLTADQQGREGRAGPSLRMLRSLLGSDTLPERRGS